MIEIPRTHAEVGVADLDAFVAENVRLVGEQFSNVADDESEWDHLRRFARVTDPKALARAAKLLGPRRFVDVEAFSIDATRVTRAAYSEFLRDTGTRAPEGWIGRRPPEGEEHWPVIGVSYWDAAAYAAWRGAALPTEIEWEIAAGSADKRRYPWGNELPASMSELRDKSVFGEHAADAWPELASPAGVLGLISNFWEWCADAWAPLPDSDEAAFRERYPEAPLPDAYPPRPAWRAIRGGMFWDVQCGVAVREGAPPDETFKLGFRCVLRTQSGPRVITAPKYQNFGLWSSQVDAAPILAVTKAVLLEDTFPDGQQRREGGRTYHIGGTRTADIGSPIRCGECRRTELAQLVSQSNSGMGGQFYEDLEVRCLHCRAYTLWSFCDKD